MNKLEYILIPNEEDKQIILEYTDNLRTKTDEELTDSYNQQQKLGMVGVRRQALYLVALRYVMKERFGSSPIYVRDKFVVGLGDCKNE